MFKNKTDFLFIFFTLILSIFLVFDIFVNKGQPATFDGTTHITTIAQFHRAHKEGELRVKWGDGFANYGMPIPLISQQTTPYLGSLITFLTKDVLTSYNLVYLLGASLSALFYYFFLRIYFTPLLAFAGTFLFNFAPYRIINLYIRGAQPEFFASIFLPLILIAIYLITKKRNAYGILLLAVSTSLIILTHPFMFIITSILSLPYLLFCIYNEKQKLGLIFQTICAIILGIGITAFYTLPLFSEIKYFHYGNNKDHFIPNQYLNFASFFDPNWYYYYKNDVYVRGNFIKVDLPETLITISGLLLLIYAFIKKKRDDLLYFSVALSALFIFLTTPYSGILYEKISLLNGIQYPWRMLSSLIFVTPIILCVILSKIKYQKIFLILFLVIISVLRFPQLYGKNYTLYPQSDYYFTKENLHGNVLNTVWTGKTTEYPKKDKKPEIISGKGEIISSNVKNSRRLYEINAQSDLRMVDNTFYFPGWWVYVDEIRSPIEYQDPNFRGMITYNVPQGKHIIELKFEDTKPRTYGNLLTVAFIIALLAFFLIIKMKIKIFYSVIPKALRKL